MLGLETRVNEQKNVKCLFAINYTSWFCPVEKNPFQIIIYFTLLPKIQTVEVFPSKTAIQSTLEQCGVG